MSGLVEELKKEHILITESFNKAKRLGITSEQGRNTLIAIENVLLAHLKKEDERLYPVLNKAAETDDNLKRTLKMFAQDMDAISDAAMKFFAKYSTGSAGIEFAEDCGKLFAKISVRIGKEENVLYQKYDELRQ